jgi:hypothetical protein
MAPVGAIRGLIAQGAMVLPVGRSGAGICFTLAMAIVLVHDLQVCGDG